MIGGYAMRGFLIVVMVCAGTWIAGCATTDTSSVTTAPANKQPQPYINNVIDPTKQPQPDGGVRY
jgi:hypothetical protein